MAQKLRNSIFTKFFFVFQVLILVNSSQVHSSFFLDCNADFLSALFGHSRIELWSNFFKFYVLSISKDSELWSLLQKNIYKEKPRFLPTKNYYCFQGDRKPKGCVLLKDVVPYICVGLMTDRMPTKRPSVPDGYSVHHLVGIGMDPRAETVHWILFSSDSDIE